MNTLYRKNVPSTALGILSAMMLVMCVGHSNGDDDGPSTIIVRNHHGAGFFANCSIINHCLHKYAQSNKKLVVLFDSALYKEDRSHCIADNPYYNK